MNNTEIKGMLFGLLGVIFFGLTLPMTKIVIPYLDPIFIGLGRSVLASIVAIIILLKFTNSIPTKKQFIQLFIIALGVVIGFPIFTSIAMEYVPASHGAIVVGVLPLAIAVSGAKYHKQIKHCPVSLHYGCLIS